MHIFFSGIGGTGIGPLALVAKQAGYDVSGSDKQDSQYVQYLRGRGIDNIQIGQDYDQIAKAHAYKPIDWYVYSSAVSIENPDAPELRFCRENNLKATKRDELLNQIIKDKNLKLIAIAGTHGKTTTTAMAIWLFKQLGIPLSYAVGAKIPFGDMGQYQAGSEYFVYEADEFDHNFLAFEPYLSLITGIAWDHHEIFPTREAYHEAFKQFISQSQRTLLWEEDAKRVGLEKSKAVQVLEGDGEQNVIANITGFYNRLDAWLVVNGISGLAGKTNEELGGLLADFPGLQRRMEEIVPGLYSDYAHTPEKIRGAMSVALELVARDNRKLVIIYEPLTDRRQHYIADDYGDCFSGAAKVYWVPSYLAREDPKQPILAPAELIKHLSDPSIAQPATLDPALKKIIQKHLNAGNLVVAMSGGSGGSLDEWLRKEFSQK